MKKLFEGLWDEYFAEKCSEIDTNEEKAFAKGVVELHKSLSKMLSDEQNEAVDEYAEKLCEAQDRIIKKAFFKGCEFATAFLMEVLK